MVEKFTKRNKICGIKKGAKTSAYCMDIYPFIVLKIEPLDVTNVWILLSHLLELSPLSLEMLTLFISRFSHRFIYKS